MSASINNTRLPSCAKTIAKFEAVVDLPSEWEAEVMTKERMSPSGEVKWIFVRSVLNCSDTRDRGLVNAISFLFSTSGLLFFFTIQLSLPAFKSYRLVCRDVFFFIHR